MIMTLLPGPLLLLFLYTTALRCVVATKYVNGVMKFSFCIFLTFNGGDCCLHRASLSCIINRLQILNATLSR